MLSLRLKKLSRAAAKVYDHRRDFSVDYLLTVVEIQHVYGRHLGGCAAGACAAPRVGLVDDVTVGVLLHAFARAVIGLVALGGNYPVPPEFLKVNGEWIPAAT